MFLLFYVSLCCGVISFVLWTSTAHAAKGGAPACQALLNTCNASLNTCNDDLTMCNDDLSACQASEGGRFIDNGDGQSVVFNVGEEAGGGRDALYSVFAHVEQQMGATFCVINILCN